MNTKIELIDIDDDLVFIEIVDFNIIKSHLNQDFKFVVGEIMAWMEDYSYFDYAGIKEEYIVTYRYQIVKIEIQINNTEELFTTTIYVKYLE